MSTAIRTSESESESEARIIPKKKVITLGLVVWTIVSMATVYFFIHLMNNNFRF